MTAPEDHFPPEDCAVQLVNSEIVDAFIKAYDDFYEPGDSYRSAVRHALETVARRIAKRASPLTYGPAERRT